MTLRYFNIKNNIKHKVGPEIPGLMVQSVAQWRWPGSFVGSLGVPFLFAPGARVFSSSWAGHVGYVGAPRIWAWFEKRKPGGALLTIAPNRSKSLSTVWKCWWFRNKVLLFGVIRDVWVDWNSHHLQRQVAPSGHSTRENERRLESVGALWMGWGISVNPDGSLV